MKQRQRLLLLYSRDMAKAAPDGYLETPVVLRLTGVAATTLNHWVRLGLVTPTVRPGSGKRRTRRWSLRDVVTVRCLKVLHDAGCPNRVLAQAKLRLADQWEPQLRGRHLFWDGQDVLNVATWAEVESVVRAPGQAVLHLVVLPLDPFSDSAKSHVVAFAPSVAKGPGSGRAAAPPTEGQDVQRHDSHG